MIKVMQQAKVPMVKRCSKCVLPESFPGIEFDSKGVCNFCLSGTTIADQGCQLNPEEEERQKHELEAILKARNKSSPWDVLVGMSGGKDSTMLAVKLKRDYGLRVFGYTFDAGFNSDIAIENVRFTLKKLHIAHIHYTVPRSLFLKVLRYYLLHPGKPLIETVCRICGALYGNVGKVLAIQMDIPLIAYGWTRGQGPSRPHYFVPREHFINEISMPDELFWEGFGENERNYVWELCAQQILPVIPIKQRRKMARHFWKRLPQVLIGKHPLVLTPYKLWDYAPQKNLRDVVELGLIENGKSHPIDTNCKLIPLFSKVDSRINGFNPFVVDIADHVREGNYDREEWVKIFEEMEDPGWRRKQIERIIEEIGMDWNDLWDKYARET